MIRFQVFHRPKPFVSSFECPGGVVFETCLRQIWIAREGSFSSNEWMSEEDSYSFLLEVITGLHSPIFGETEIQGQFKKFLDSNLNRPEFKYFHLWAQYLLEDAKALRSQYLQGEGAHSYGSFVRKCLNENEAVCILGAGELTKSLLPWLAGRPTSLWVRNPERAQALGLEQVIDLKTAPSPEARIIVAAPLSNSELESLLGPLPNPWIDLREAQNPPQMRGASLDLKTIFQEQSKENQSRPELVQILKLAISNRSQQRLMQSWIRPKGWEDLCVS